jgi:hypothetical protein
VRNPWNTDNYSGPWSDSDSRWTTKTKSQVAFANSWYDGAFYIEDTDFVNAFYYFQINHIHDDWAHSYYEVISDNGAAKTFTFTIKNSQELFVSVDFYDYRMYAPRCKTTYTTGTMTVKQGSTTL